MYLFLFLIAYPCFCFKKYTGVFKFPFRTLGEKINTVVPYTEALICAGKEVGLEVNIADERKYVPDMFMSRH
jgi:hypothetical protein